MCGTFQGLAVHAGGGIYIAMLSATDMQTIDTAEAQQCGCAEWCQACRNSAVASKVGDLHANIELSQDCAAELAVISEWRTRAALRS